ncbi:MAG: FAD-dependent oxidoreductase [Bacteroidetes bacterium]|nr:FAD-dependent oxidoreductase [Bacteroidota bacterium]
MEKQLMEGLGRVPYPARDLPVTHQVDVVVVGGGTAGVAAAVAAARQGADTLLVERYGFLGGTSVAAPVPVFQEGPRVRGEPVIRGIYAEQKARLAKYDAIVEGPAGVDLRYGRAWGNGFFQAPMLQLIYFDMCEEAGVRLLLHTYLVDAIVSDGRVTHLVFANKGGLVAVAAKQLVDATGDGDLAVMAGARSETGRPGDHLTQPPTVTFELGNVDVKRMEGVDWDALWPLFVAEAPEVTIARNCIFFEREAGEGRLRFGSMTHVPGVDASNPDDRTRAEIVGRRQAKAVMEFFRRHVPGCERCFVIQIGIEAGIRETRRIVGDYVLTRDDILGCRKFDDVVGCSTSWIDVHHPEGIGVLHEMLPRDDWFEVPYRALVSSGVGNVYTVGRCMSCTHEALGALRTMPTTIMTGEAAGAAAGLSALAGLEARKLDVGQLQQALAKQGVFLGSAQPKLAPLAPTP